jgi:hypothetical protein
VTGVNEPMHAELMDTSSNFVRLHAFLPGAAVDRFEADFADYLGRRHFVSLPIPPVMSEIQQDRGSTT